MCVFFVDAVGLIGTTTLKRIHEQELQPLGGPRDVT